jgi:hypothetical protein
MTLYIDTKPKLEWVERKDGHKFYADIYELQQTVSGRWIVIIGGYVEKPYFETADHGKQYAQADYERRTAERFKAITLPPRMDARQGDGSVHYCTGWNDVLDAIAKATEATP